MGLTDYAAAISIILFIGLPHIGELATLDKQTLTVQTSFRPSSPDRTVFFVQFWKLPVEWIFLSIIPGAFITVLFYWVGPRNQQHNLHSRSLWEQDTRWVCMGYRSPWDHHSYLRDPWHTASKGSPSQAPLNSESLLHTVKTEVSMTDVKTGETKVVIEEKEEVYEQRWSPLLEAGLILAFISPPFQHMLGLTPKSILADLYIFMGEQSLAINPTLYRFFYLLIPSSELPALPKGVRSYWRVRRYTRCCR